MDDELLAEAKRVALERGQTLGRLIEDALRRSLSRRDPQTTKRIELPIFRGGRLLPGVDLDNNAALLDLMDGLDGSA